MKRNLKKNKESEIDVEAATAIIADTDSDALLRKTGIYYITGSIEDNSLKSIHQDILLKHLSGPQLWDKDIQLVINSPGGSCDEANSLLDLLANVRMDINTIGLGTCASAAAMLLACGTKGKRVVGPSTIIMTHRYSWGIYDKHAELVARREIEDVMHDKTVEFWINHSKYTKASQVEKHLLRTVDTYMDAKTALSHGIIDKISGRVR